MPIQFSLFADGSFVIGAPPSAPGPQAKKSTSATAGAEHRRAVRGLKNVLPVIEQIDLPEAEHEPR